MKILLDTHALVWWLSDDSRLSREAVRILEDPHNEILVSAAVGWELAIKVNLGKIHPASLVEQLEQTLASAVFTELPIAMAHAIRAGLLPPHHRDPFDRLLAAQAQAMKFPILSADRVLDQYAVQRVW
jgi:PIN domain nuclease of toxin-antitoxin system